MVKRVVYAIADNIYSPLGKTTAENMLQLGLGKTGIQHHAGAFSDETACVSLFSPEDKKGDEELTAFEQITFRSAAQAMAQTTLDPTNPKTGFILSTTKGNIGLIEYADRKGFPESRISLNSSADIIAGKLGTSTAPLVVSHACISGLLALITGMRLMESGIYDTLIISGGDLISSFIYSGFRSFQAISANPCKPFDANRDGISLGEAAATVILSVIPQPGAIRISGGSVSNDANHISGPSRTGEELALAIRSTLKQAGRKSDEINFISAHGTATRYNDEMEAKAFHLTGLNTTPTNSLKGYYGHTLGAAGILESVVTMHSMKNNQLLPTLGFHTPGTEMPVNIITQIEKASLQTCLKTASGFGGCNAALLLETA